MKDELPHEDEQWDGDQHEAPCFVPGDEGGLRHGPRRALQDQNPKESNGPHGKGDGDADEEEK